jgi:hypothetical protein
MVEIEFYNEFEFLKNVVNIYLLNHLMRENIINMYSCLHDLMI